MSKKILFLDDDRMRHITFMLDVLKRKEGVEVFQVYDADQAIEALKMHHFDLILLDHDLGGQQMASNCGDYKHGCYVARFIALHMEKKPDRAISHSFNPAGRDEIASILHDAGVATIKMPFGSFTIGG